MVKIKPGPTEQVSLPRSRGRFLAYRTADGRAWVQAWPKKRGKAKQGGARYQQQEFALVASWAASPEPIAFQTAMELVKGSDNVPRDILMMASYGTFYTFNMPDGITPVSYRMVAPNAQLILDQVTDVPNSMLWRSPIGWVALPVGNDGDFLSYTESGPIWTAAPTPGGNANAASPTSPYLSDPNRYASVITFGTGAVSGQAFVANRMVFIPVALPLARNVTSLAVKVSTLLAASQIRLGLFADDHAGGGPGTLLADGGNVSSATTGLKTAAISVALQPGLYWLCAWPSGTQSVYALASSWSVGGLGFDMNAAVPSTAILLTRTAAFGPAFGHETGQTHTVGGYTNTPIIGMR